MFAIGDVIAVLMGKAEKLERRFVCTAFIEGAYSLANKL